METAQKIQSRNTERNTQAYVVTGMSCHTCSQRIEHLLGAMPEVDRATVNYATQSAEITSTLEIEALNKRLYAHGYALKPIQFNLRWWGHWSNEKRKELNGLKKSFLATFLLALPIFLLHQFNYLYLQANWSILSNWIQLGAAAAIIILTRKTFLKAFSRIRQKTLSGEVLLAAGLSITFVGGITEIYLHEVPILFEVLAIMACFSAMAKYLELAANLWIQSKVSHPLTSLSNVAQVVKDADEIQVPIEEIKRKDHVLVRAGDYFPVDGCVVEGSSKIDQSAITGNPEPKLVRKSDIVLASSKNLSSAVVIRAENIGNQTQYARMFARRWHAYSTKSDTQRTAEIMIEYCTPIILVLTGLSALGWLISGAPLVQAFLVATSVLLISSPRLFALATSLPVITALNGLATRGSHFQNASDVEKTGQVNVLLFHKTGILTHGCPTVTNVLNLTKFSNPAFLSIIASVEHQSMHPLAVAIENYAQKKGYKISEIVNVETVLGHGVRGTYLGLPVATGDYEFVSENASGSEEYYHLVEKYQSQGKTVVCVSLDNKFSGLIATHDPLRQSAKEELKSLQSIGTETILVSGSDRANAKHFAEYAGIGKVISAASPRKKAEQVVWCQNLRKTVGMVGDGPHDFDAMAKADVSFNVVNSLSPEIETASAILIQGSLGIIVRGIRHARKFRNVLRQNIVGVSLYHLIALPLAMSGIVHPVTAISMMFLGTVLLTLNAIRLK